MHYSKSCVWLAAIITFFIGGIAESSETSRAGRHSSPVILFGPDTQKEISSILIGTGIDGMNETASLTSASNSEITWKKRRERVDELGMRHVFYRQYFSPLNSSVAAESLAAKDGVWLVGAELGMHYDKDGTLVAVLGTQFERGVITSMPLIGQAADAYSVGQQTVVQTPEFSENRRERWPSRVERSLLSKTTMLLHSVDDNGLFRYVWEMPTLDNAGHQHIVTIDAEDGSILSIEDRSFRSECAHENTVQDSAIGVPQNSDISDRSIWATRTTDDRGEDYTHDGHKKTSGNAPEIQVFMGDANACGDLDYAALPLETDSQSGKPIYDVDDEAIDVQNVGADALFFTFKTMVAFDTWGWDSWDDSGSAAVVVVDALRPGCTDNAFFINTDIHDYAPESSIMFCPRDNLDFSLAAAIDVVAHEWGHAVVYESAGWTNSGDGADYHEGYADLIGNAVEWRTQPSGSGNETEDWESGEDRNDSGTGIRPVDRDDGNPNGGLSYHKNDPATPSIYGYNEGHRLPVAHFLMADGDVYGTTFWDHKNPWCKTDGGNDDCDVTVTDIGVAKASKILFHALTNYATASTDWEHFGIHAQLAAYSLYKNCPHSWAPTEQRSAYEAFAAIGYEPAAGEVPLLCW